MRVGARLWVVESRCRANRLWVGGGVEVGPVQDRVDIDGNRLGDLVTPVCGSRTVWVDDVRSPPGKIVSGRIFFVFAVHVVIRDPGPEGRPPHSRPQYVFCCGIMYFAAELCVCCCGITFSYSGWG